MANIYRVFIRHENETQPTWFKIYTEQTREELTQQIMYAMQTPAPSLWHCIDTEGRSWAFRADKIYSICVSTSDSEGSNASEHIQIS